MARFAAVLAYDGSAYRGFQRQKPPTPTIQAAVERAIARVSGEAATIVAAGRTDAGVHAAGQVIAFDLNWRHKEADLLRALNANLPADIALQSLCERAGFHPRYDALWRQYVYRIALPAQRNPMLGRQIWQLPGAKLDMQGMKAVAALCLGEQDFAAFGSPPHPESSNTRRTVFVSRWQREEGRFGPIVSYRIRGTAFLYHMVRRLVGAMVEVGRGAMSREDFEQIVHSRDIKQAKALAPPIGLVLEAVGYPPARAQTASTRKTATVAMASLEGTR